MSKFLGLFFLVFLFGSFVHANGEEELMAAKKEIAKRLQNRSDYPYQYYELLYLSAQKGNEEAAKRLKKHAFKFFNPFNSPVPDNFTPEEKSNVVHFLTDYFDDYLHGPGGVELLEAKKLGNLKQQICIYKGEPILQDTCFKPIEYYQLMDFSAQQGNSLALKMLKLEAEHVWSNTKNLCYGGSVENDAWIRNMLIGYL
jgi:hypothetical protein